MFVALPPGADSQAIIAAAERRDIQMCDPDGLRFNHEPGPPGLLLGYGNLNDSVVEEVVEILAEIIASTPPRPGRGASVSKQA